MVIYQKPASSCEVDPLIFHSSHSLLFFVFFFFLFFLIIIFFMVSFFIIAHFFFFFRFNLHLLPLCLFLHRNQFSFSLTLNDANKHNLVQFIGVGKSLLTDFFFHLHSNNHMQYFFHISVLFKKKNKM